MKKFFIPIAISAIVLVGLLPGGCAKSGPTALSRVDYTFPDEPIL